MKPEKSSFSAFPTKEMRKKVESQWPIESIELVSSYSHKAYMQSIASGYMEGSNNNSFIETHMQGYEVNTYFRPLKCDMKNKRTITGLKLAQFILWPEVQYKYN